MFPNGKRDQPCLSCGAVLLSNALGEWGEICEIASLSFAPPSSTFPSTQSFSPSCRAVEAALACSADTAAAWSHCASSDAQSVLGWTASWVHAAQAIASPELAINA